MLRNLVHDALTATATMFLNCWGHPSVLGMLHYAGRYLGYHRTMVQSGLDNTPRPNPNRGYCSVPN